ncbi:hypothetical protein T12_16236, partial [Trichinella patagoniensis]
LLGRDATGSIAALFNYFRVEWIPPDRLPLWNVFNVNIRTNNDLEGCVTFRVEWIPPDRLPLWNVFNVNIRTNNDLEGWYFKMNRLAGKRHLGFYELLQLLIDEQGSTETVWYYSVPFFSYWSLPSLFYWTVKSLSYWFSFYWAVKCLSYWFSLSNCSLIQTLQL